MGGSSSWDYHTALLAEIRSGKRIDPDLWFNPASGEVEQRPGTHRERREQAMREGWLAKR